MKLDQRESFQMAVAYLYDPIQLDKVVLDTLKETFGGVQSDPDFEFIFAESAEQKKRAQILSARLDYIDEAGENLEAESEKFLRVLLRALPQIKTKGLGVTLYLKASVEGEQDAGLYAAKRYLSGFEELESKLKSPIIASLHRITYGEPTNYFDMRITPEQIGSRRLQLQLRKHKDASLSETDRIIEETLDMERETIVEFDRLLDII
jgi:hypothetical protein